SDTWWEGGAGLTARLGGGFTLDGAFHSGLKTTLGDKYAVRKGRLQVAEALAKDPAYTARLKWTGVPGLEVAASLQYQSNVAQSTDNTAGSAWLGETHVVLNRGPFTLKALYAQWNLQGSGPESVGADEQKGWYIEPSYKLTEKLGMFARYNRWDNRAGDNLDSEYTQWNIGMNYWIHPDVVVKVDYQDQSTPSTATELDGFNVGIGYQF
ncbi:MAG: porin, partial [Thiobacillus sp.]